MRRLILALSTFVLLAIPLAGPAAADGDITTVNRTDMMAVLTQAGLTAVSDGTTDEAGPWIMGKTDKNIFLIVDFYQCEAGVTGPQRQCSQFRYRVYWENNRNVDAKAVGAYNEKYVFGRGYVTSDGKYLYLDYAMNLDGGVTRDHLVKNLNYFLQVVDAFTAMVLP